MPPDGKMEGRDLRMASLNDEIQTILNEIQQEIQTGLHDLIPEFKECVSRSADENVYSLYTPTQYERRENNGGLSDPGNYEVNEGDMSLTLVNNTPGNAERAGEGYDSGAITDLIESGTGYHWRESKIYKMMPYPRPFMEKAENDFADSRVGPMIDRLASK